MPLNALLSQTPQEFLQLLKGHDIQRCYFITDGNKGQVRVSHPFLQPIADFLQSDRRDFAQHEGIFLQVGKNVPLLLGAFVHQTKRGQAQGGTRLWKYPTVEAYLRDGLRLSAGMTWKNAIAGLWWGGGKGVISDDPNFSLKDPSVRKQVFEEYGEFVTSLQGCYITAEDVGTNTQDVGHIFSKTRFTTCIPKEVGGSGNPSKATARGVIRGLEAACQFLYSNPTLKGKTAIVQGLGNVGSHVVDFLMQLELSKVIGTDINAERVEHHRTKYPEDVFEGIVTHTGDPEVLSDKVDFFIPCATGGILNPATIPQIQSKVICGAANNQLEDSSRDDLLLFQRGLLYVPDFIVNRMGIVNCANEQYGYVTYDPYVERHLDHTWEHSVFQTTLKVLKESQKTQKPPAQTCIELAKRLAEQPHPIFGHRARKIIESLVESHWERR